MRMLGGFVVVGAIGFLVDAGVLALLLAPLGPYLARAVSFVLAVATTWALNRRFTFAAWSSGRPAGAEFAGYFGVMLTGGAVNYGIYAAIVAGLGGGGIVPFAGLAIGSLAGMAVNLTLSRLLIYRHRRND